MLIIKVLEKEGCVTTKEAETICDRSAATVRRYLGILTATGLVAAEGSMNNSIHKALKNHERIVVVDI